MNTMPLEGGERPFDVLHLLLSGSDSSTVTLIPSVGLESQRPTMVWVQAVSTCLVDFDGGDAACFVRSRIEDLKARFELAVHAYIHGWIITEPTRTRVNY